MLRTIAIAALLAWSATAYAAPTTELDELGVRVLGSWSPQELAALARGAQALPAEVRAVVGPIWFSRVHHACPFAMGAYNRTCPTYATEDGQRVFVVYDSLSVQGQGPPTRLAALNDAEQRDLLVRRAVVHAFIGALEQQQRWSDDEQWRRLDFWRPGVEQPFNRDPWGYSRYLGMQSPQLDLVTFAEEYFVRPETVLRESAAPDAPERLRGLDRDLAMECQEFSKTRFLVRQLRNFAPAWTPPEDPDAPDDCAAFTAWAGLETLEGIDVLYAAATADRPQSLWGHLLVHIRHHDRVDGFEPVYQFGAVIAADIDPFEYLGRGLMGGFYAVLDPNDFRSIDREILRSEQRSLKRYRLQLSKVQSLRVLQRIWEMERRTRLPYWFFDENCAAFLADLVQSALVDVKIDSRSDFIVAPTDVLDHFAAIDNPPVGKLLRKLPEEALSNRERARWARAERGALLAALRERFAGAELHAFDATRRELESLDPNTRSAAYANLGALLATLGGDHRVARVLSYNVMVERYYLESRTGEMNKLWAKLRLATNDVSVDERLAQRRELYLHEDLDRRAAQRLARDEAALAAFQSAPRREPRPAERRLRDEQVATRDAFLRAVHVQRAYHERNGEGAAQSEQLRRDEEAALRHDHAARDARSIGKSGKGRLGVGGSAVLAPGLLRGGIEVDFAFLAERLGSQRQRGFRPDIETQVFALNLLLPPPGTDVDGIEGDLVLLRYLTIEQLLGPARRSWLDVFGYGFDIHALRVPRYGIDWGLQASGGLLLPVLASESLVSHLVFGAFPTVQWLARGDADRAFGGVWGFARAQLHLWGNYANVARLEAAATPTLDLATFEPGVALRGDLALEVYLGEVTNRPVLLVPHATVERTNARIEGDPRDVSWRVGLRLESAL